MCFLDVGFEAARQRDSGRPESAEQLPSQALGEQKAAPFLVIFVCIA